MNNKCVYVHKKQETGEVFYVGIGSINRPYQKAKSQRSVWWFRTVAKYGLSIEIIATNLPDELAKKIEISLIKLYGRRDKKEGTLINLTDGGDGTSGMLNKAHSEETKRKLSLIFSGAGNHWFGTNGPMIGKFYDKSGNHKSVLLFDNDGHLIKKYDCIKYLCEDMAVLPSSISNNLNGFSQRFKYNNKKYFVKYV